MSESDAPTAAARTRPTAAMLTMPSTRDAQKRTTYGLLVMLFTHTLRPHPAPPARYSPAPTAPPAHTPGSGPAPPADTHTPHTPRAASAIRSVPAAAR